MATELLRGGELRRALERLEAAEAGARALEARPAAAAHEFGHIMGLPDEYIEFYAPRGRVGVTRLNPGSLMSGHLTGVVHPRHRRAAYSLLAVHSVVAP